MSASQRQQPSENQSDLIVFSGFHGLNTQASRIGIQDTQACIMDGWFPIGNDNARIIPDLGAAIFVATGGRTIAFYGFSNIGATPYCIIFLSDGSIVACNTTTLSAPQIAPAGTILNPSQLQTGMSQWGSTYILIVSNQTNGYFIWDGTTFYGPGGALPGFDGPGPIASSTINAAGTNYAIGDTGTIGTGAATYQVTVIAPGPIATATLNAAGSGYAVNDTGTITTGGGNATYRINTVDGFGAVLTFTLTAPGTAYGDGTNVPTAVGGGQPGVGVGFTVNNTVRAAVVAYAIVVPGTTYKTTNALATSVGGAQPGVGTGFRLNITVTSASMPTGISGTAVETYSGHVWVVSGALLEFCAPGEPANFSTADGGGNLTSTDSTLRVRWTGLLATNGYLYLLGDSSISYIANVQTTGTGPSTTTFTLQNADPEIGTPWPGTIDVVGNNIVFANAWGGHVSYGGRTAKISTDLDGIYNTLPNFGGLTPSGAKAILYGKRVWILLLPVIDSYSGQQVNKLFLWDEKRWCSTQQRLALTFIQHQEIDSVLTAYGTDGNAIYPLFQTPSPNFQKVLRSKFWAIPRGDAVENAVNRLWGVVQYFSPGTVTLTISLDSEYGASPVSVTPPSPLMTWQNNVVSAMTWQNNVGDAMVWVSSASIVVLAPQACGQRGVLLGFTVVTTGADLALLSLSTMPVPIQGRF